VWRVLTGPPVADARPEDAWAPDAPVIWWSLTHAGAIATVVPVLLDHARDVPARSLLRAALAATTDAHAMFEPLSRGLDTHMSHRPAHIDAATWEQVYLPPAGPQYEQVQRLYEAQSSVTLLCHALTDGPRPGPGLFP
jgi:hypothetical protein